MSAMLRHCIVSYERVVFLFVCFLSIATTERAFALESPGSQLNEIGLFPVLGAQVDTSVSFTDSEGHPVSIANLLASGRPLVVVPVYYRCPRLCGLLLGGLSDLLQELSLEVNKDFQILAVSFNPVETVEDAAKAKTLYVEKAGLSAEEALGWRFVVGEQASIASLMDKVGFRYKPDGLDFAHSAGLILLTPTGVVAQYFTGIEFPAFDVRLALVEASQGSVGSALDHVMLYCFRFDPTKGKYTWVMVGALRIGGAITLVLLGGLIVTLVLRERAWRRKLLQQCSPE